MKKINANKKGFTIVELVIVIAVIGILAAILIPTFINLNNKAKVSNTTSFLKNINTQLAAKEANPDIDDYVFEEKGNRKTIEKMSDGINYADDVMGFNIRKISPFDGNEIVWDMENHRFALIKDRDFSSPVYAEAGLKEVNAQYLHSNQEDAQADLNAGKNIYLNPEFNTSDGKLTSNGASIDASDNMNITEINIESDGDKDVYVSTNNKNCNVVINTPNADVYHDGIAGKVDLKSVPLNSYHENGSVKFVEISKGRIALEAGAEVSHIHINAKVVNNEKTDEFDKVIISYDNSVDLTEVGFSRDDVEIAAAGTLVVALQAGTETPNESTEMDYVWLTKQGIYEQIKVSDNDQSAGTVWADDSSNSAETQDAAQKIANNYVSETVRPTWESDDTNRDLADINNATEIATAVAQEEAGEAWESMTAEQKAEAVAEKEAVVLDATQAVEAQPDKETVETGATLFAGGTGTKNDPFLIVDYTTFQHVSDLYEEGYYCFKVKDGIKTIDCKNWKPVFLYGSIDGNNVTLNNLDKWLFDDIIYGDGTVQVIKDMTINCRIIVHGYGAAALCDDCMGNVRFENIDVNGYIEGRGNSAVYVAYGSWEENNNTLHLKNCGGNATLLVKQNGPGIYMGHHGTKTSIILEDCHYSGTVYSTNGKAYTTTDYTTSSWASFTEIENGVELAQVKYGKQYTNTNQITYTTNDLGSKTFGDNFEITASGSSSYAVAEFMIAPNGNGVTVFGGSYTATYMTEELTIVDGKYSTSDICYYHVAINPANVSKTGLDTTTGTFNVVNPSYNNTYASASVMITEYDVNNNVIAVWVWNLPVE